MSQLGHERRFERVSHFRYGLNSGRIAASRRTDVQGQLQVSEGQLKPRGNPSYFLAASRWRARLRDGGSSGSSVKCCNAPAAYCSLG
jgi:hypothetical protein